MQSQEVKASFLQVQHARLASPGENGLQARGRGAGPISQLSQDLPWGGGGGLHSRSHSPPVRSRLEWRRARPAPSVGVFQLHLCLWRKNLALEPRFSWPQPPAAPRPCPSSSGPWCWAPPRRPEAQAAPRAAGPPKTGHGERASVFGCWALRLPAACPNPTPAPLRLPPPCVSSARRTRSAAAWKLATSICIRLVAVSQLLSRHWMKKCGEWQGQFSGVGRRAFQRALPHSEQLFFDIAPIIAFCVLVVKVCFTRAPLEWRKSSLLERPCIYFRLPFQAPCHLMMSLRAQLFQGRGGCLLTFFSLGSWTWLWAGHAFFLRCFLFVVHRDNSSQVASVQITCIREFRPVALMKLCLLTLSFYLQNTGFI